MRLGPGKHLAGRKLWNGLVKPEQFDYFHEVCVINAPARFVLINQYSLSSLKKSLVSVLEAMVMVSLQMEC